MKPDERSQIPPDARKLTTLQAARLSQLAKIGIREISDQPIAQLSEKYKWKIPPEWLLFRRICGQVVRTDPVTGTDQPVPFATVHVYDTDCDLLGYFPHHWPWVWCFPLHCHREEIGSAVADECGHFCLWIPAFDIDWVVRWRLERRCFPEIFVKPSLADLLEHLRVIPPKAGPVGPWPPGPGPDPGPLFTDGGLTIERIASVAGRQTAMRLAGAQQTAGIGQAQTTELQALLSRPAFVQAVPPPISPKLQQLHHAYQQQGHAALAAVVRGPKDRQYHIDPNRYIGPFLRWRCVWVIDRELVPILDVPDITFRITQDIDGDGEQETIYSEGFFDVRWNSGPIADITLHAWPIARPSTSCNPPQMGPCGDPQIRFAGLMPTDSGYIDTGGFAVRPNPPHADGVDRASVFPPAPGHDPEANAPFMGTLQLYGCSQHPQGHYYRLLYSYNGAAAVPFTSRSWWLDSMTTPGTAIHITADAQGWYPIIANPTDWFPPYELLDWPTSQYPDGLYQVTLEIGDAAKNHVLTTAAVPFYVDNSAPPPHFVSLAWRVKGTLPWNYFPDLVCPVVHRPAAPAGAPVDIEFRVEYVASMPHLLKVVLTGSGCGGGAPQPESAADRDPYSHWHTDKTDNSVAQVAQFTLEGSALQGAYGFYLRSFSRAMNPAGGDPADPQAHDWYYDASWLNWNWASLPVAVVNL